jgi:hypothetical protein
MITANENEMSRQQGAMTNYSTTFTVDQSPIQIFDAIDDVRGWWTGDIVGETQRLGDEVTYRYEGLRVSTQRVTESVPGKRVGWEVVDGSINFVADKAEWIRTAINFDIAAVGDQTEVRFSHVGSRPNSSTWTTAPRRGATTSTAASGTSSAGN